MEVDWFRIFLGFTAIAFGLYGVLIRAKPTNSTKIQAMEKQWGKEKAQVIHLTLYGFLPILLGLLMLLKGFQMI